MNIASRVQCNLSLLSGNHLQSPSTLQCKILFNSKFLSSEFLLSFLSILNFSAQNLSALLTCL